MEETNTQNASHEAFLMTVSDNFQASLIEAQLKQSSIPVRLKFKGMGAYLSLYMGKTSFGVEIYVPSDLAQKARDIVSNLQLDEAELEADESDSLAEAQKDYQKRVEIRSWAVFLFIVGTIAVVAALSILK